MRFIFTDGAIHISETAECYARACLELRWAVAHTLPRRRVQGQVSQLSVRSTAASRSAQTRANGSASAPDGGTAIDYLVAIRGVY